MKISAGLLILHQNKVLLVHPVRAKKRKNFWSIPKGKLQNQEKPLEAAIRETYEETGLQIDSDLILKNPIIIDYKDKKRKTYKRVFVYKAIIHDLTDLKFKVNSADLLNSSNQEVDNAKFFSYSEAKQNIFWRFKSLLNYMLPSSNG